MINIEVLMAAGAEKIGVQPASPDPAANQGKSEVISFAKSFNERIEESELLHEKISDEGASVALPILKSSTLAEKPGEFGDTRGEVKGKTAESQDMSAHSELKSVVAGKFVPPQTVVVAPKTALDTGAKGVAIPAQVEEAGDADPSSASAPKVLLPAGLTGEGIAAHVSVAEEERPLVELGEAPVVQKEIETAGNTKESAPAIKTTKMQASTPTKTVQKSVGPEVNAMVKPSAVISTEGAATVVSLVATGAVVPRYDSGKTTDEGPSEAIPGIAKAFVGSTPAIVSDPIGREIGQATTSSAVDTEPAAALTKNQAGVLKAGAGLEKVASVAGPAGSSGDNQTQSMVVTDIGQVHAMAGGAGFSSGALVVGSSGPTSGDLNVTKPTIADAGGHHADFLAGSREQEGAGVVASSMEGMPRMLTATPTALEVGIQNGTHGWLKVRAEMADGGVVNASVSAASSVGQEMLHRELPALSAYLQQEKVAVNAVVVHAPSAAGAESRGSTSAGSSGGQTPQRSNEGEQQQGPVKKTALNGSDEAMPYQGLHGFNEDGSLPLAAYVSGGNWLSVRA